MNLIFKFLNLKKLYIFLLFLSSINIFFSTENINAKTFSINDIKISSPFENNFDKYKIIDKGFEEAFSELIFSIVQSKDQIKIKNIPINQIKGMIETFSIKEEKFIDEIYYLTLNVSFNKKTVFDLLEKRSVFPSLPIKKNFFFIPVIVDENENQVFIYSENVLYDKWNFNKKKFSLLNYILPTEDLEDFNLIKRNIKNLENYDFKEIIDKYNINDYIIMIIFKNKQEIKVFNKIVINQKKIIKNFKFNKFKINDVDDSIQLIEYLKLVYEDFWKSQNQINTSVKLLLNVSIKNNDNIKIDKFETMLSNIDLIYNYYIYKFDNKNNFYKVVFNGSPDKFLELMKKNNYELEIQNKVWVIR